MNTPNNTSTSLAASAHEGQTAADTNKTLPTQELFNVPQEWPQEIIIEPPRLASGIWGDNEGDIQAAYCADTFPKVKVFVHEGQLFANCGDSDNSVSCYPLISPEQYNGRTKQPYSHEGETVKYRQQSFALGPKIQFTARPRTLDEETSLLRRKYAYGGFFASGKTYREMLTAFLDRYGIRPGEKTAIETELARENLPNTQAEMLGQIGGHQDKSESDDDEQNILQSTLPGL